MTNKETRLFYNDTIEIDFYPDSHRYKLKGEKSYLLSATAITGIIDKSRVLINWALGLTGSYIRKYLEEASSNNFSAEELAPIIEEALNQHNVKRDDAADIGSQVHDIAQRIGEELRDGKPLSDISEDLPEAVKNGVCAFIDWVVEHKVKFLECERMVYSKKHKFVGITDAIVEIDGKKYLIDYKTSKGIYSYMNYQVAGYTIAYEEETKEKLDGQMLIHFNKETGEFAVKDISKEDNIKNRKAFLHCLGVKQREKELNIYN
jgi:hypothetical protein